MTSEPLGQVYWSVVEPHWDRISIYDGAEAFRREFEQTPQVPASLFAAHWCVTEVCNGGFHQFFWNSTGVLAPEAAAAFEKIQLRGLSETVRRSMVFFAEPYPREREARQLALEAYERTHPHQSNPFSTLDDEFFTLITSENGGWESAADRFARSFPR
jgi:hypothetical protein